MPFLKGEGRNPPCRFQLCALGIPRGASSIPSLSHKSRRPRSSTRRWREMHHFPRGTDKFSPLSRNLQVSVSPSLPHLSENRACHWIIHHVLKRFCNPSGPFLKNKKTATWVSQDRPTIWRPSWSWWKCRAGKGLLWGPLINVRAQVSHSCLATSGNYKQGIFK